MFREPLPILCDPRSDKSGCANREDTPKSAGGRLPPCLIPAAAEKIVRDVGMWPLGGQGRECWG